MVDHKTAMAIGYRIPGEMWPTELGWLYYQLAQSRVHVEVGTFCGRSLWATCAGLQQPARVIAVDANVGYTVPLAWVQGMRRLTLQMIQDMTQARAELIEAYSVDAARQVTERGLTGQVDSVFIDGNHNAAEVMADCQAWWPLLREGGTMCGHDYWAADPGVMDAVQQQFGGRHQVAANTRIWWVRK
jgi:predicted O-methyltransferase YrrM